MLYVFAFLKNKNKTLLFAKHSWDSICLRCHQHVIVGYRAVSENMVALHNTRTCYAICTFKKAAHGTLIVCKTECLINTNEIHKQRRLLPHIRCVVNKLQSRNRCNMTINCSTSAYYAVKNHRSIEKLI